VAKVAADAKAEEDRVAKAAADAKAEEDRVAKVAADAKAEEDRVAKVAADAKAEEDRVAKVAADAKAAKAEADIKVEVDLIEKAKDLINSLDESTSKDDFTEQLNQATNSNELTKENFATISDVIDEATKLLREESAKTVADLRKATKYDDAYLTYIISSYCGEIASKKFYKDTKYDAFRAAMSESCEKKPAHYICENDIVSSKLDDLYNLCKAGIIGDSDASFP